MKLESADGARLELQPIRYQFPATTNGWDANWLIVRGDVHLVDGRTWAFEDPCLLTSEARGLGSWLKGVVEGVVPASSVPEPTHEGILQFTEPNLGFSLAQRTGGRVQVRVHLSLESLPPWLLELPPPQRPDIFDFYVLIDMSVGSLADASDSWHDEVALFPER